jgi:hypothetical protein
MLVPDSTLYRVGNEAEREVPGPVISTFGSPDGGPALE